MGMYDSQNLYSDAQAVTASALSDNSIDHGYTAPDLGKGENLYVVVECVVAMTDSGSDSTVAPKLQTDGAVDGSGDLSSGNDVFTLGTFSATSAAGSRLVSRLPHTPTNAYERYSQMYYTVSGGSLTTGSFTAYLSTAVSGFTAHPSGYSISS